MKRKVLKSVCCILILTCFFLTGCRKNVTPTSQTAFYFDTVITITLYDEAVLSAGRSEELFSGCFALCADYENLLSRTREGSDIWKINHASGAPVTVAPETAALLQQALSYCEETGGAADITIAPLSDLWDFSSESLLSDSAPSGDPAQKNTGHAIPSQAQLQELLPHVDYHTVQIDGNTVTLADPSAALDLGCIAKGYIADRLKEYLKEQGVMSAVINLGGNILTLGEKPDGSPFRLGIQKPFAETGTPISVLSVSDASLVSSGVYERYFEADGKRYHHLLNTNTGMPEQNGLLSVTVLSEHSADGDMLSTACFLLGLEKGMAYIESLPDTEAVFITEDYELHPSSGLSGLLQKP